MATALRWMLILLSTYAIAWCSSYVLIMTSRSDGLALEHFFEYFALAWSFSGGELPTFVWLGSLLIFLVLIGLVLIAQKVLRRKHESAV